jgi:amidohydrolase
MLEHLIYLRHDLHRHPEISGNEQQTAMRIKNYLLALHPNEILDGLGGHGIIATFDSGKPGPALLFRAELDALPIQEINDFAHRSNNKGVSHKCGHDGHATILCGVAKRLAEQPPRKGKVHLLFQPSEENGSGAEAVLNDPKFAAFNPDMGVALHNFPHYPLHSVIVKPGTVTAAVSGLALHIKGKTAHASQPEYGLNPAMAVAELLKKSHAYNLNEPALEDFQLITPIHVHVGSAGAFGVAAGDAEVQFTLRAWTNTRLETLRADLVQLARGICLEHGLELSHTPSDTFYANTNDAATTDDVRTSALQLGLEIIELSEPLKGGEDFGLFTSRFPCCMFMLGAGEDTPALHSPDYDFPDALIGTGIKLFESIVRKQLG